MTFDEIINSFAHSETVPVEAIRAALDAPGPFAEGALRLLERVAAGASSDDEDGAVAVVIRVLGETGEERAFEPLMRVLTLPSDDLEAMFGDAITETLGNVLISLVGDRAQALEEALIDTGIDAFVRDGTFEAWTWLVLTGKVEREKARAFLQEYPIRIGLDLDDFGWSSWVDAVTILGFAEMRDFAAEHLARRVTDSSFFEMPDVTFEDFERQLSETSIDPECWRRMEKYQPYAGTIDELSGWYGYSEQARRDRARLEAMGDEDGWGQEGSIFDTPYIAENPYRDVGRNDPCPCGSGKKYKKCCLN